VRSGIQAEDRDEEHPWMLRRQSGHADVPEHAQDAELSVLADDRVIAERG
jgi:hypothetical protein